jgi:hypothetical protein
MPRGLQNSGKKESKKHKMEKNLRDRLVEVHRAFIYFKIWLEDEHGGAQR